MTVQLKKEKILEDTDFVVREKHTLPLFRNN